jgi:hypothetical protein
LQASLDGGRNRFTDQDLVLVEPRLVAGAAQRRGDPTCERLVGGGVRDEDAGHPARI